MLAKIGFGKLLFVFMILISFELSAQDKFESWISEDQFLISRMEGARQREILVSLPSGKEKAWTEGRSEKSYFRNSLSLDDGSLIELRDNDLVIIKDDGSEEQLTRDSAMEKNARLSNDLTKIAYTKSHNLFVFDLDLRQEKQLTFDGSETIYNGWASWVYYEEILGRSSQYAAFWWSPDSKKITFLRFDDSPVPKFTLFNAEGQHGKLEVTHYPKAGDATPVVQFAIADISTGEIIWAEEDQEKDQYSALPFWTPDGKYLLIQELNRSQDTLHIVRINPADGHRLVIYEETQSTWVEFFEEMDFINDREFIIRTNRSGWYNLYRCTIDGQLPENLTPVPWRVTEIESIDLENQKVYFYGTGSENTDRHFYSVNLDGKNLHEITLLPGWHNVIPSPGYRYFLDDYSTFSNPGHQQIVDHEGKIIHTLVNKEDDNNLRSGVKVESFIIKTEDGFNLPAYWVLPKGFDGQKKYPVVFTIYGGPDAGNVRNRYQDYSGDYYANHDIIRIAVDHRGSGKFGKRGMDYMHRNLGKWEMEDLITSVKWLRTLPYIDSTRIGITGGSYGGYVTCMALTYGADYFTHGISLFPVTDWLLYDNVYTERYMDTPIENPAGYQFGSAMEHAYKYKGNLLIIHGMMDDNVHMQNTVQFISKMQDLGKDFELMMYPGERHGWGGSKRMHLNKLVNKFWDQHFFGNSQVKMIQP